VSGYVALEGFLVVIDLEVSPWPAGEHGATNVSKDGCGAFRFACDFYPGSSLRRHAPSPIGHVGLARRDEIENPDKLIKTARSGATGPITVSPVSWCVAGDTDERRGALVVKVKHVPDPLENAKCSGLLCRVRDGDDREGVAKAGVGEAGALRRPAGR
jgi:hypothetical protein